tara:strand:+ start:433 stop:735 length:303 start_codon:yes stop_codon:yes gene_type:complete
MISLEESVTFPGPCIDVAHDPIRKVCNFSGSCSKAPPRRMKPGTGKTKERTMSRAQLITRLQELQKMPKFEKRDIRSIAGFLPNEALEKHVKACEEAAQR